MAKTREEVAAKWLARTSRCVLFTMHPKVYKEYWLNKAIKMLVEIDAVSVSERQRWTAKPRRKGKKR